MAFAFGTRISTPGGFKAIEELEARRDVILAANFGHHAAQNPNTQINLDLNWSPVTLLFSSGVADTIVNNTVFIDFGGNAALVATMDQLFLLPDGKLKQAVDIVPGMDFFVSSDGRSQRIHKVSFKEFRGGFQVVSAKEDVGELNGHLILTEGIVSLDYHGSMGFDDR